MIVPIYAQTITTIAGDTLRGNSGDGGQAVNATIHTPLAIAIDNSGNIYIADAGNNNIRKVDTKGVITTIAGSVNGHAGNDGDDIAATNANIWKPHGIAVDKNGNVLIPEFNSHTIRKISTKGIINTIAGTLHRPGSSGYPAAPAKATRTLLNTPNGIAIDKDGNIYFADQWNYVILKIATNGMLSVVAGNGLGGHTGNKGPATAAELNKPWGVATDNNGNIYFTDAGNNTVHKIDKYGIITLIAGNGEKGYSMYAMPATEATLNEPCGIAVDEKGNIYIAEAGNHVVRYISPDGILSSFAGTGKKGYSGDNGPAIDAMLNEPYDVKTDKSGNVYIADAQNHVIRKVTPGQAIKKEAPTKVDYTITPDTDKNELLLTMEKGAYASFSITDMANNIQVQQPIVNAETRISLNSLRPARYFINLKKSDGCVRSAMFVKQ